MRVVGQEKPALADLVHFGVKGMRWGTRKTPSVDNPRYGSNQRAEDLQVFGKRGVNRINNRMNSGQTHEKASNREFTRQTSVNLAVLGATVAATILLNSGHLDSASIINRAETRRARNAVPALMTKAAKVTFAKKRGGAFVVTSLK